MSQAATAFRPVIGYVRVSLKSAAIFGARLLLFMALYYLAVQLGLGFRFQNSQIGVVWPANAVLLSALLLTPRNRWWLVFVAAAVAHAMNMAELVPAWRWSWQIVGNSVFTASTALILQRVAGEPLHFASRRQVFAFTAVTLGMSGVFAFTTAAYVRSLFSIEPFYDPVAVLTRITFSNTTAILLVTPTIVLWTQYGFRHLTEVPKRRALEALLIMMSMLVLGLFAFSTDVELARFPLIWIIPSLLWAAVRLGPMGAATSLFCGAALSIWGASRQLGPFVLMPSTHQVVSLQLFWIVVCLPIMVLAAVVREREQAERALAEQRNQLAHVTRVATAGELSGALAHELRQPLTSILANAQAGIRLLDRAPLDVQEVREILEDITQQDKHAANVIERLSAFVKEGDAHFETLAVEPIVRDALALSRGTVEGSGVAVEARFAADLPPVRGDAVQLLQVLINLVINACESMSTVPTSDRRLRVDVAPSGERDVEVQITDRGVGLPNGRADRVFEPFFTTKEKGLGLGLVIGRSIVTAHGGRLWGENNPDKGATFHLVLHAESATSDTRLRTEA